MKSIKTIITLTIILISNFMIAQENKNLTPSQVYMAFGQSMMSGTKDWYNLLHDDIEFIGPVDQSKGKEAFIKLNESFLPTIRGNKMIQMVESGNYVITLVEIQVLTESDKVVTLKMNEWYEVVDGKFKTIRVFYDSYEFRNEGGMKKI